MQAHDIQHACIKIAWVAKNNNHDYTNKTFTCMRKLDVATCSCWNSIQLQIARLFAATVALGWGEVQTSDEWNGMPPSTLQFHLEWIFSFFFSALTLYFFYEKNDFHNRAKFSILSVCIDKFIHMTRQDKHFSARNGNLTWLDANERHLKWKKKNLEWKMYMAYLYFEWIAVRLSMEIYLSAIPFTSGNQRTNCYISLRCAL